MIVVQPEKGLGNRLRVISSFRALARRAGRPFAVSWVAGNGWSDEHLDDLFEHDFPCFNKEDFGQLRSESLRIDELAVSPGDVNRAPGDWASGNLEDVFDTRKHPIVTYQGSRSLESLVPRPLLASVFPSFRAEFARAAREWQPVPDIQWVIDRVVENFDDRTVGVHIRRGDAVASRGVGALFRRSSDDAFVAAMDRAIGSGAATRFFLATDSEETETRFRERYGRVVITNPDKVFVESRPGQPKANQRDAVIDMFALARTRQILGNYKSSFSKFAAVIGAIEWEAVVENDDPPLLPYFEAKRSSLPCNTVASFSVNGVGLGHASRLVAVHDELRREGVLKSVFFVRHEMEIIKEYRFTQTLLPRYEWYLMELSGPRVARDPVHDVARTIVEMTLRGKRPIILHDVFVHRAVYEVAVAAGWPQAMIFRDRLGISGPTEWVPAVAPAISLAFWIGHPGQELRAEGLYVVGVDDVVRPPLGRRSMWREKTTDEVRILVTAGGGGHRPTSDFLNAAIGAINIVSHRVKTQVRARIVTGPYFDGEVSFPAMTQAAMTVTRYVSPKFSLYADATVVVAQAGYNTVQELSTFGVPHVLVPLPNTGFDDQQLRAKERSASPGVHVAESDPFDIARGIEAVMAHPPPDPSPSTQESAQAGAWQIATLLEVLSEA